MTISLPVLVTLVMFGALFGVLATLFHLGPRLGRQPKPLYYPKLYTVERFDQTVRIETMLWRAVMVAESYGLGNAEVMEYELRCGWYQLTRELHWCRYCQDWGELQPEYPQREICVRCATTNPRVS